MFFPYIGNVIIPTVTHSYFSKGFKPPETVSAASVMDELYLSYRNSMGFIIPTDDEQPGFRGVIWDDYLARNIKQTLPPSFPETYCRWFINIYLLFYMFFFFNPWYPQSISFGNNISPTIRYNNHDYDSLCIPFFPNNYNPQQAGHQPATAGRIGLDRGIYMAHF